MKRALTCCCISKRRHDTVFNFQLIAWVQYTSRAKTLYKKGTGDHREQGSTCRTPTGTAENPTTWAAKIAPRCTAMAAPLDAGTTSIAAPITTSSVRSLIVSRHTSSPAGRRPKGERCCMPVIRGDFFLLEVYGNDGAIVSKKYMYISTSCIHGSV